MKEVTLNINWKTAARIHIECVKYGSNPKAVKEAEAEIMRMADLLDQLVEEVYNERS